MYCSVGIHPHEADIQQNGWQKELQELAANESVRAIGEMGLDYYYEHSGRDRQKQVFEQQLELAEQLHLPVIIHCRNALEDCLGILSEWQCEDVPVVFHCFGGNPDQARVLLDRDYYLSFTGMITFKNALAVQKTVQYVPLEKVMLETDCPYLSPEPKRNVKPNEPAFLVHIAEKVAQLKDMAIEEIAQVTTENSRFFFGLE